MIHCNLSVLLAERRLKISTVAASTGISRTTLTALAYNNSQGIQMSTLNTLCIYLSVTPDQLISFFPVDIVPGAVIGPPDAVEVRFLVRDRWQESPCALYGSADIVEENGQLKSLILDLRKGKSDLGGYDLLIKALHEMPPAFLNDIETTLFKRASEGLLNQYCRVGARIEANYRVLWPSTQKEKPSEEG